MENQEVIEKITLKEEHTVDELRNIVELRLYGLMEENRTHRIFGAGKGLDNLRNILNSYLDSYIEQYKLFIDENTYDKVYDRDTKFYIVSKEELESIKVKARILGDCNVHENWIEHIKPFTKHKILEVHCLKFLPIMQSEYHNKQDEIQMIPNVYYKDKLINKEMLYEISKQNSKKCNELANKRISIISDIMTEHNEELKDLMRENLVTDTVNRLLKYKLNVALNIKNTDTTILESLSYGGRKAEIVNIDNLGYKIEGKRMIITALQLVAPKQDDVKIDIEMLKQIYEQTKGTDTNYFIILNEEDTNIEHPIKIYMLSDDEIESTLEKCKDRTLKILIKELIDIAYKKYDENK